MISGTMTTEINDEYALMEEGTGPEIVKYGSIDDRASIIPPIKPLSTKAFSRNKYEEDFKKNRDENKKLPFYMRDVTISEFYNEIQSKIKLLKDDQTQTALAKYTNNGVLTTIPNPRSVNDDLYFILGEFISSVTYESYRSKAITDYHRIFKVLHDTIVNNYCRNINTWIRMNDVSELRFASINLVKMHVRPFIESVLNIENFKDIVEANKSVERALNLAFVHIIKDFNKYDLKSFETYKDQGTHFTSEIKSEWQFRLFGVTKIMELIQSKQNFADSELYPEKMMLEHIESMEKKEKGVKKLLGFMPDSKSNNNNSQFQVVNTIKRLGYKEKNEVKAIIGIPSETPSETTDSYSTDYAITNGYSGKSELTRRLKYEKDIDDTISDVDSKHSREDEALLANEKSNYSSTPVNYRPSDSKKKTTHLVLQMVTGMVLRPSFAALCIVALGVSSNNPYIRNVISLTFQRILPSPIYKYLESTICFVSSILLNKVAPSTIPTVPGNMADNI
jgi:hypothetical protein